MDKLRAINEMESWAERHGVALEPSRRLSPGESYVGIARLPADGQVLPVAAVQELFEHSREWVIQERGARRGGAGRTGSPQGCPTGSSGGAGASSSPVSITGDRVTEDVFRGFKLGSLSSGCLFAGVDQGTFTGHGEVQRESCLKMLQKYLGEGQPGLFGKNLYRETWVFDCGAFLAWTPGREDFSVTLRGRSMRHVGQDRHRQFIIDLWRNCSYATRLDCRVDDYSRSVIRMEDFEAAYEAGNWCGARKATRTDEKERGKSGLCRVTGKGVAFGSRSGARLVAYDKALESKGEICANRLELAYYDQRARLAFDKLAHAAVESEAAFVRMMGELITGPVDFRERADHRHLKRMERLAFWEKIVEALGWVRLKVEKSKSTLMGSAQGLRRQYLRKLGRMAVIAESQGKDIYHFLFELIEGAKRGQDLDLMPISPRELGFDLERAFQPAT